MRKAIVGRRRLRQRAQREILSENLIPQVHIPIGLSATENNLISDIRLDISTDGNSSDSNMSYDRVSDIGGCDFKFDMDEETVEAIATEENSDPVLSILDQIQNWALDNAINHKQLGSLLKILKVHDCFKSFPVDSRSLVRRSAALAEIRTISPGHYVHFGISPYIRNIQIQDTTMEEFNLQLSVDGLPIYRSSTCQFWPILGHFVGSAFKPFVIGIYSGLKKPESQNEFLKDFIDEYNRDELGLVASGKLKIHSFICDTPARSFIKGVKGHMGYFGCDKCCVEGNYINRRMSYFDTESPIRTNESFRRQDNEEHHVSDTNLKSIPQLDMINAFPLDYMHLICLGVVKKMLILWTRGRPKEQKLSLAQITQISGKLTGLSNHTVTEFSRKPRSLVELDRWKATEFRQFLLYTGPIILKSIVSEDNYNLFMSLSVAIRILSSQDYYILYNNYAKSLLIYFVNGFKILFGEELVSYNVHGLIHLTDDSKRLGPLDLFSAFRFESKLGTLKKLIRTPSKPLQQIRNRLLEKGLIVEISSEIGIKYSQPHENGPVLDTPESCRQYRVYQCEKFVIKCNGFKDSYVLLNSKSLLRIKNILHILTTNETVFIGNLHNFTNPFFLLPCDSGTLNILKFKRQEEQTVVSVSFASVLFKCQVFIVSDTEVVAFPLIHSA